MGTNRPASVPRTTDAAGYRARGVPARPRASLAGAPDARSDDQAGWPVIPRFRAVGPSPAQLAADSEAPHLLFFGAEIDALVLATSAIGLGITREGGRARVVAGWKQMERLVLELR